MTKTQIVFIAFGPRADLYAQIYFSIRSIQRWQNTNINFVILTDQPDFFNKLANEVTIIQLSENMLKDWSGKHRFLWRVKMKAIEHAVSLYPSDNILYFDSDTVIAKDIALLTSKLDVGHSLMHTREKTISTSKSNQDKRLTKNLQGFQFLNYSFNSTTSMYNAGVIGLPANQASKLAKESIALCDALCDTNANKTFLEQLAFSMALSATGKLIGVQDIVIHYWGNKKAWDAFINTFIQKSLFKNLDKAAELECFNELDFSEIPFYINTSATNRRFKKLIDKIFSRRTEVYFQK